MVLDGEYGICRTRECIDRMIELRQQEYAATMDSVWEPEWREGVYRVREETLQEWGITPAVEATEGRDG